MGKQILTDAYIAIGGTAWSDHANKVTINANIDSIDVSSFGPSGFKQYGLGLADGNISVDFFQDFAGGTASLDNALYALWLGRGTFTLEVRPTSAAAGTANPKYTMTAFIPDYVPLDGQAGAASTMTVGFSNAGTAGIVRGTS